MFITHILYMKVWFPIFTLIFFIKILTKLKKIWIDNTNMSEIVFVLTSLLVSRDFIISVKSLTFSVTHTFSGSLQVSFCDHNDRFRFYLLLVHLSKTMHFDLQQVVFEKMSNFKCSLKKYITKSMSLESISKYSNNK